MSIKIGAENDCFKMPKNYEFLKFVANDSLLRKADVLEIFDISDTTLYERIKAGNFPKPDSFNEKRKGFGLGVLHKSPSFWKKETVVNEIRRLQGLKIKS